jgi:oligopeptide transport system substrate-binding protein
LRMRTRIDALSVWRLQTRARDRACALGNRLLSAVFLVVALSLVACSGNSNAKSAPIVAHDIQVSTELAADQILNRHLEADPRTLDPSLMTDVVGQRMEDDLFEGLVTLNQQGHTVPGVATSWETSADGKTWTFYLRGNACWSNGKPVTADDFVYAWRRQVDPATGSEYSQALAPIENAMDAASGKVAPSKLGVESAGPRTLVVHLNSPTPYLLALLTNAYLFPIYEPAVKQWGDAWTQAGHLISNGPFFLTERVLNGHISLQKNPYYWDAKNVRLTQVIYHSVSDYEAASDQYLAGNIDFGQRFNISETELLKQTLGDQVVLSPSFATAMFGFNLAKPPFQGNPKLRLALSMALDRDILMKYLEHGVGIPAYNIMPPLDGYKPVVPDWARLSDDDRHALARKLYREAGYSDAHPLETVITYASSGPQFRRFMEALSAMWLSNLGAKVQIYNVEWKVMLQSLQLKQPVFYWDAWVGDFPDPFTFMQLFQTGFGMNYGDYSNPQFDAYLDQASNINDNAARFALFQKAEAVLNDDGALLPVYVYVNPHLIKPYVKGWQANITDRNLSRYMYILAHQEL